MPRLLVRFKGSFGFSSPNSLNPPCEQLIHVYTLLRSVQLGKGQPSSWTRS